MADDFMDDDRFWSLIAESIDLETELGDQAVALAEVLRELSVAEVEAFERAFQAQMLRSYTWDLWGAAYVIHGECSDDCFEYFRRWLIAQGLDVFDAAVNDSDALAEMLEPDTQDPCEFEEFGYVASTVWSEKTGIDPWSDPRSAFPPPASLEEPFGVPFEKRKIDLAERFPRLWARFGSAPLQ